MTPIGWNAALELGPARGVSGLNPQRTENSTTAHGLVIRILQKHGLYKSMQMNTLKPFAGKGVGLSDGGFFSSLHFLGLFKRKELLAKCENSKTPMSLKVTRRKKTNILSISRSLHKWIVSQNNPVCRPHMMMQNRRNQFRLVQLCWKHVIHLEIMTHLKN